MKQQQLRNRILRRMDECHLLGKRSEQSGNAERAKYYFNQLAIFMDFISNNKKFPNIKQIANLKYMS